MASSLEFYSPATGSLWRVVAGTMWLLFAFFRAQWAVLLHTPAGGQPESILVLERRW